MKSRFDGVDLQWFSGEGGAANDPPPDLTNSFQPPAEDEEEIVVLPPGQEAPKAESEEPQKVSLTMAEYEELKKRSDQATALADSVRDLGKTLQPANAPRTAAAEAPIQGKNETDEEFAARVEAGLWEKGGAARAISEVVRRNYGPVFNLVLSEASEDRRSALRNDRENGEFFRKYEKEIEAEVAAMPQDQRVVPRAWNQALDKVRLAHQGEIMADRVKEEVAKTLQEMGIEIKDGKPVVAGGNGAQAPKAPRPAFSEGGGAVGAGAGRRTRYITAEEDARRKAAARAAEESGVDAEAFRGGNQ